jgi:hypothetical protein
MSRKRRPHGSGAYASANAHGEPVEPVRSSPIPPPAAFSFLGWIVADMDGDVVGTVDDLIIGPAAGRSRYLAIFLDPSLRDAASPARWIIAPLGCARFTLGHGKITLRALAATDCIRHLTYAGGAITTDDEVAIWIACGLVATARLEAGERRPAKRATATGQMSVAAV